LSTALLVKEYAPDLARSVIDGSSGLDAAYEQAKARKKQAEYRDDGLRMLREAAPDLATRVVEEEIDLAEARKRFEQRARDEAAMRDSVMMGMRAMTNGKSEALKRLPSWLMTDEGVEHLERYYPGGGGGAAENRRGTPGSRCRRCVSGTAFRQR
jgi:hypothetical protein